MNHSTLNFGRLRRATFAVLFLLCAFPLMAQQNTRRPSQPGKYVRKTALPAIKKANGKTKNAYSVLSFDYTQGNLLNGLVNYSFADGAKFNLVRYFGDANHDVTAAAYADGYYYVERTKTDIDTQKMIPVDLLRYDIEKDEVETVGDFSGFTSHINDMTYDYSTKTMYAISVYNNTYSVLYTIDLKTAAAKQVATLDRRFFTLACNYAGQLYAISFEGDLCKVDKNTGAVTLVGATGFLPTYYQTMEFDHTDNTLYWAANLIDGSGQDDCIAMVDTETGKATQLALVGDYPQLVGLYIPFSASAAGTPAAVSNFEVVEGANGATTATLTWTNPTTTFDGASLGSLSAVKVYRDHELITTLNNAKPGAAMTYTDNLGNVKGALHTYTVVATNATGDGAEVKETVFVGRDVPMPVFALNVVREGYDKVRVKWSQADEGKEGGYVDKSSLTYTVTRYPDNKVLTTTLKETSIEDVLPTAQHYSYAVQAKNTDGESEVVKTNAEVYGPTYTMPVNFDFTDANADDSWTVVDANEDDYAWTWTETSTGRVMGHQASSVNTSDDWLIGYYMPFEKDAVYRLDLDYHAYSRDNVEISLLDEMNTATPLLSIGTMDIQGSKDRQKYSVIFTAPSTGFYNLALHALSPMRADWLEFYALSLRKAEKVNLAATAISGDENPVQGKESKYTVKVENQGVNKVFGFRVVLKDQDGNELMHKDDARTIKSGEALDVELAWTPETRSVTGVRGEVVMPWATGDNADANPDDNATALMAVNVREAFDGNVVELGTASTKYASYGPFNLSDQYAAALNIYGADEIGDAGNSIVKLAWQYDAMWQYDDAVGIPVRVYMANTDRTKAGDGWIDEADLTLVYDGTIDIAKTTMGDLTVVLDKPFAYEKGKNLAVLTAVCSPKYYPYTTFKQYTSPLDGNGSFEWGSYYTAQWFDWTQNGHKDYYDYTASVVLYLSDAVVDGVDTATLATLEGTHYDIFDLGGSKVAEGTFAANGAVDTSNLGRGVYVVNYKQGAHTRSMKLSVNR